MRIIKDALACTTTKDISDEITERRVLINQIVGCLGPSILQSEVEKLQIRFQELKDLETLGHRRYDFAIKMEDIDDLTKEIAAREMHLDQMVASTDEARRLLYETAELSRRKTMLLQRPEHQDLVTQVGSTRGGLDEANGKIVVGMRFFASENLDQVLIIDYKDGSKTIVKSEAFNDDYGGLRWCFLPPEPKVSKELRPGVWILDPQPVVKNMRDGFDISGVPCFMGTAAYHLLTDRRWPGYKRIWQEDDLWVGEKICDGDQTR